jgi:hypothetical protein
MPDSNDTTALNDTQGYYNDGDNQQEMNVSSESIRRHKSENPHDDE